MTRPLARPRLPGFGTVAGQVPLRSNGALPLNRLRSSSGQFSVAYAIAAESSLAAHINPDAWPKEVC